MVLLALSRWGPGWVASVTLMRSTIWLLSHSPSLLGRVLVINQEKKKESEEAKETELPVRLDDHLAFFFGPGRQRYFRGFPIPQDRTVHLSAVGKFPQQ